VLGSRGVQRRAARFAVPIAVASILLLSGIAWLPTPSGSSAGRGTSSIMSAASPVAAQPPGYPVYQSTLTVNSTPINLSGDFYGTTINNEVRLLRGETEDVNATPARVLVWPGAMAGEDYDPFTETHYDTYDGNPTPALTTEAQFVAMCRAINCTAIMQVPAEIDDPSLAERVVNYTEDNLSFRPAYWMIGNEPELWEHWQVPWADWASDYTNGPDPTQFGQEVVAYVHAIRQVDNTTPILGLPASGCTCGYYTYAQWISGVLNVTGSKIQAVAFHEYPAGWLGTGDGSLEDFYDTIQSPASIPVRIAAARAAVRTACGDCNVSVFISELGAALSWSSYGQYAAGFSGALSIASQLTQAMDLNVTNVDLFAAQLNTSNSWFGSNGASRPDYALYTEVLDRLGSEAYAVNVSGLGHTLYGIDTVAPNDAGRQDLLVMNDNITHSAAFTPEFAGSNDSQPVEVLYWNGSIHDTSSNDTTWVEPFTPNPVPEEFPDGLPSSFTLPPQSMVLFESYPSGASFVQVLENNVPNGTAWYASVGSELHRSTASNISLLLPPGDYPISSVPIPLPIGGKELTPVEQLAPFVSSPLVAAGVNSSTTVQFVPQWRVNVTATPAGYGTVGPNVTWWNASAPLNLTVAPTLGYAFDRWSGWGPGSFNGTGRTITVLPTGRVTEKAIFVAGQLVDLMESGLPPGTPWSVTVRGFTTNSTSNALPVYEPNGSYGYSVAPVAGYRILPRNGGFTVVGWPQEVHVRFVKLTPPPLVFPVTFEVTGLPDGMGVPITVRNSTLTAAGFTPEFGLINGTYAYRVGYTPGYHVNLTDKTFLVHGGPLLVRVPFVPTVYAAHWVANGARAGVHWGLELNGSMMRASSSWVSTNLTNGTYPFMVELPSNFSASPRSGSAVVDGSEMILHLNFTLLEFRTGFIAAGLVAPLKWSVRLGNETLLSSVNVSNFLAVNGTYTFDVHPPAGYYADPSHGKLTVAGATPMTAITFHLTSNRPSAALIAALSEGALTVAVWIGVAIAGGYLLVRWVRSRGA
jgi:hypothetical protein